ncbi:DUF2530 domain-containing protein [Allosaccharopolyspora coralli]|uniref:DUF2530 domain-containing protein n=1 Tax=Allosaccharopolyspora coralli TaxID=2665642 RepID=A0A5Q3Q205_9PSEU|nr:DUF2530 domain-containing protein [Allosaccharopolyspora coralli]QGK68581.1 DUF2530 domain-containing protein [Allosaccharopolyspora coralli]
MADEHDSTPAAAEHSRPVPGLPSPLVEPTPVVLAATLVWMAAFVFFALTVGPGIEFWTSLTGVVLGFVGYAVFWWQRSASRRGSRGAWKGLSGLD